MVYGIRNSSLSPDHFHEYAGDFRAYLVSFNPSRILEMMDLRVVEIFAKNVQNKKDFEISFFEV